MLCDGQADVADVSLMDHQNKARKNLNVLRCLKYVLSSSWRYTNLQLKVQHTRVCEVVFTADIPDNVMFLNILIGKEHERVQEKTQLQLNKSVSLWLLCCLFAAARALRFNMLGLSYLFPPGRQPSCVLNVYMD